jgi:hypothetical protein
MSCQTTNHVARNTDSILLTMSPLQVKLVFLNKEVKEKNVI